MSKQDQKQFIESLTKIIEYLKEDERKDYNTEESYGRAEHIYTHVVNVRQYIENGGFECLGYNENSQDVDRIAQFLVAQFWLGAEIGIGNSSTRDMSQEQYYELNKKEWIVKAVCLIKAILKLKPVSTEPFDTNCNFQQIRTEVKERNMLLTCINRIRGIAISMPNLVRARWEIIRICDDAIYQVESTNKGAKT